MGNKNKRTIKRALNHIAITARLGADTGEFTRREILDYISNEGNATMRRVFDMRDVDFAIHCLESMMELMKNEEVSDD